MTAPEREPEDPAGQAASSTEAFERALAQQEQPPHFVLQLFVAGSGEYSLQAVSRIRELCEAHLAGRYDLEVVDIYQHPSLAEVGQVIAAPTLIRHLPPPLRRVVGDMADEARVLVALGVRASA